MIVKKMIKIYKDKKVYSFPELTMQKESDCLQALKSIGVELKSFNLATLREMNIGMKNY